MSGEVIGTIIIWLIIAVIVIAIVVWLLNWLYHRSTKEVSFVRTGFGGEKVVINGGAIVLPIIHEVTPVNMNVLQLEITRERDTALITRDRMRVDLSAEFYVRVQPTREAVSAAAATLGRRTLEGDRLHQLLAGKFTGALRTVAAEMTMEEMHEHRGDYVTRVKATASEALAQNGLELETVAITDLDQTDLEYFNPSNRFDAEGLTKVIEEIESRRKQRNDIEQDSMIRIRTRNLEAERQTLDIERESETARLDQERDVEIRRAAQRAEATRERAQRQTEAEEAEIAAREAIERARIAHEEHLNAARIAAELETRRRDIERGQAVEAAEIAAREAVETARIRQERKVTARPDICDDPRLAQNVARLADFGWCFELQVFAGQMESAARLVRACPDVTFVLQHAGMPEDLSEAGWKAWGEGLDRLAAEPNVVTKLSAFGTFVHRNDPDLIARVYAEALHRFGASRAMFGSNFPIEKLWTSYGELIAAHRAAIMHLSAAEQQAILAGTARRVYRLPEPEAQGGQP